MARTPRTIERPPPPYAQVAENLESEIAEGTLQPGDMIPSERELAEMYGISRATATKAVATLRSKGLVESVVGVGTMVASKGDKDDAETPPLMLTPRDRLRNLGRTRYVRVKGETSEIEAAAVDDPPVHVRRELRLPDDGRAFYRSRITRDANGDVVEVSTSWFDADLLAKCPRLQATDQKIPQGTTRYVADCQGVEIGVAYDVIEAVDAGDYAPLFDTKPSQPILMTAVTVFDDNDEPLTYEVYRHPPTHRATYEYELGTPDDAN